MGVPAFYRWLTEKYPKIVSDVIEKFSEAPLDLNEPNPNGMEFDNLYIDMNGVIHPCSHPEDRPAPESEQEMFCAVIDYIDRLFAAIRPRKILFLAIDGVAPRAKMNQQRSRRFKAIQERKEHEEVVAKIREDMIATGLKVPPKSTSGTWDSNVITPGTEFMEKLAQYVYFAIIERMNTNPAWQKLTVIFSDASESGEGEHKIMNFIRSQRAQPGYNPNTRHILHGLDADLIMLGLATHEPHFYILREMVTFGRKDQNREHAQVKYDAVNQQLEKRTQEQIDVEYFQQTLIKKGYKALQILHIPILREYLLFEFKMFKDTLPFEYNFERIIDDFVFLMFFVGNDFLPHLPSMDIRDGAIDFLYNVYKRLLPTFDGYLTSQGGDIDLRKVSVLLTEVGEVEDEIFVRRKQREEEDAKRKSYQNNYQPRRDNNKNYQTVREKMEMKPVGKNSSIGGDIHHLVDSDLIPSADKNKKNSSAAEELRQRLSLKRKNSESENNEITEESKKSRKKVKKNDGSSVTIEVNESANDELKSETTVPPINKIDSSLKKDMKKNKEIVEVLSPEEIRFATSELKKRIQDEQMKSISVIQSTLQDEVRLGEQGWKDRYYTDKYKDKDITKGGGRQRVYQSYIEGLCWVMKYYYQGCVSWKWFYPFHYAPFASDLVDVGDLSVSFEESMPFTPIQQLLAVLPKESASALPAACRELITDPNSHLSEFFPDDVPVDPNGKPLPWLWVILLPFIDENKLVSALKTVEDQFTEDEHQRNSFGPANLFVHSSHTLFNQLKDLYSETVGNTITIEDCNGFSGTLETPDEGTMLPLYEKLKAPKKPAGYFHDIESNNVISVVYKNPKYLYHRCELLPGAKEQDPVLEPVDVMTIRIPRLNRALTISDLGKKDLPENYFHFGGLNKVASVRMISHSLNSNYLQSKSHNNRNNWESQPRNNYHKSESNRNQQYGGRYQNHDENHSTNKKQYPNMRNQPFKFNHISSDNSKQYEGNSELNQPNQNFSSDQELRSQLQQTINQKKAQQSRFVPIEENHPKQRNDYRHEGSQRHGHQRHQQNDQQFGRNYVSPPPPQQPRFNEKRHHDKNNKTENYSFNEGHYHPQSSQRDDYPNQDANDFNNYDNDNQSRQHNSSKRGKFH